MEGMGREDLLGWEGVSPFPSFDYEGRLRVLLISQYSFFLFSILPSMHDLVGEEMDIRLGITPKLKLSCAYWRRNCLQQRRDRSVGRRGEGSTFVAFVKTASVYFLLLH